jgi:hypothetical protein
MRCSKFSYTIMWARSLLEAENLQSAAENSQHLVDNSQFVGEIVNVWRLIPILCQKIPNYSSC